MKKIFLPLVLIIFGGAAGTGAGLFLGGASSGEANEQIEASSSDAAAVENSADSGNQASSSTSEAVDYFKIPNQFIVPIIHHGKMTGMVIMSLAIEGDASIREEIFKKAPKLRDAFLRVMFDHANIGGFDGNFIETGPMQLLQDSLKVRAQSLLGDLVYEVLILEIARQELE